MISKHNKKHLFELILELTNQKVNSSFITIIDHRITEGQHFVMLLLSFQPVGIADRLEG